jgi:hypothetical protein
LGGWPEGGKSRVCCAFSPLSSPRAFVAPSALRTTGEDTDHPSVIDDTTSIVAVALQSTSSPFLPSSPCVLVLDILRYSRPPSTILSPHQHHRSSRRDLASIEWHHFWLHAHPRHWRSLRQLQLQCGFDDCINDERGRRPGGYECSTGRHSSPAPANPSPTHQTLVPSSQTTLLSLRNPVRRPLHPPPTPHDQPTSPSLSPAAFTSLSRISHLPSPRKMDLASTSNRRPPLDPPSSLLFRSNHRLQLQSPTSRRPHPCDPRSPMGYHHLGCRPSQSRSCQRDRVGEVDG